MTDNINKENKDTYDFLNSIGPGFCLAKWTQVTVHLESGTTHSCHHPVAHKIPLEEIEKDPGALHNTLFKKEQRKAMLQGKRPSECDYCWRIEDNTNQYSERVFKSHAPWSQIDKDKIANSTGDENFYPRYVEVSFSNVCNFKCTYCGPNFSSKWMEEIKNQGPYQTGKIPYNKINENLVPIPEREHNPYIEAFWKWFPEAVKHMHTFRITGGEPLLSKHTFRVMEHLLANPQPNLHFSINSNACPPGDLWNKFITLVQKLEKNQAIKSFTLFVSAESTGKQAEYSRDGMTWEIFAENVNNFCKRTNANCRFMSAFNILSLPTLDYFLHFVLKLKLKYNKKWDRVLVDFAYVRHPQFLDIKIATPQLIEKYLKSSLDYMRKHERNYHIDSTYHGFDQTEIYKLDRIYKDCVARFEQKITVNFDRKRLGQFIKLYDQRRNKSFVDTFPEYKQFLEMCRNLDV